MKAQLAQYKENFHQIIKKVFQGKSLSLIIGACKWLRDNKENYDLLYDKRGNNENKKAEPEEDSGLPSWVNNFQNAQKRNYIQNKKELKQKILKAFMRRTATSQFTEKGGEKNAKEDIDDDFINYESENDEDDYFSAKKVKTNVPGYDDNEDENDDFKVK